MSLSNQIRAWFSVQKPPIIPKPGDYAVTETNGTEEISVWNTDKLGTQPTSDQLIAMELPIAIANELQALQVYASTLVANGFTVRAATLSTTNDVIFSTDPSSRSDLTSAYNLAISGTQSSFNWWAENGWVILSAAQIESAAKLVGTYIEDCYTNLATHYQTISTLTTIPDVSNYDFTTNWPLNSA